METPLRAGDGELRSAKRRSIQRKGCAVLDRRSGVLSDERSGERCTQDHQRACPLMLRWFALEIVTRMGEDPYPGLRGVAIRARARRATPGSNFGRQDNLTGE